MKEKLVYLSNLEELSNQAAEFIQDAAVQSISEKGYFSLVLAGGGTPRGLYNKLAREPFKSAIDWSKVFIFWGDDRCVPFTHEHSNYKMSKETLLDEVSIPAKNIFPMPVNITPGEDIPALAEKGAFEYEKTITGFFKNKGAEEPVFDLVLLGMGDDGHTASLFPGDALLQEDTKLTGVVNAVNGKPPCYRISLTLPIINKSSRVLFLLGGDKKTSILNEITAPGGREKQVYPVERIQPAGELVWYIYRAQ